MPGRGARWLSWLLGAALLAAVILAALHFSDGEAFLRLAERAEPLWLIVAVFLDPHPRPGRYGLGRRRLRELHDRKPDPDDGDRPGRAGHVRSHIGSDLANDRRRDSRCSLGDAPVPRVQLLAPDAAGILVLAPSGGAPSTRTAQPGAGGLLVTRRSRARAAARLKPGRVVIRRRR